MLDRNSTPGEWRERVLRAKLRLLRMHYESRVGHIGGNLSCLEILLALYHDVLKAEDEFVLSKGHSAGALYVALWSAGRLDDDDLNSFHKNGTKLSGHPPAQGFPEVLFGTGSLGHGLSLACGLALAKKLKNLPGRVFCLTSDGEWNEGSTWEALIFLQHQRLDNLTFIVDSNGLQGFGTTREIADLDRIESKFAAFGVATYEVDGHDPEAVAHLLQSIHTGPAAVVARTTKGHGVSFIENRFEWHYWPLSPEQYQLAVEELSAECEPASLKPC
jgi:transketolase